MLAIKPSSSASAKTTPHLLPCHVSHNGTVPASRRHWNPLPFDATPITSPRPDANRVTKSQAQRVYFRGRRLLGRQVPLHPGYSGLVAKVTDDQIEDPLKRDAATEAAAADVPVEEDESGEEDEPEEPVKAMKPLASFDSVLVWGHDEMPAEDDTAIRGLSEWIGLAETMHEFEGADQWWKKTAA